MGEGWERVGEDWERVGEGWERFRFRFRTTCPRLQHSRRGTQKMRGSQPPQGGLLGPA